MSNITELHQTADMMSSDDYKERFRAEYYQLKIRYDKLQEMLSKWDSSQLDFTPVSPRSTYNMQSKAMADYLAALKARSVMEGVDL